MPRNFYFGLILLFVALILFYGAYSTYNFKPDYALTPHKPEKFDPSLERLDNVQKIVDFTDSLILNTKGFDTVPYPVVLADVIADKFMHGYTYYNNKFNWLGSISARILRNDIDAIVLPNDIMKFPQAACSQQQIIFMKILDQKGFTYRKVGLERDTSGHFCAEVYYDNKWHFFDPNLEPNLELDSNNKYNRYSLEEIIANGLLAKAYPEEWLQELMLTRTYGEPQAPPAPRATPFQKATKIGTYFLWILPLFGGVYLIRNHLKRKREKI